MTKERFSLEYVHSLYMRALLDLVYEAASVHRAHHDPKDMQMCTLLSIKTGGCTEDCGYCSQSVHNDAPLEKEILMKTEDVLEQARKAKESGSTRFCMGAAWPRVLDGKAFDRVCDMVKGVTDMGLEACCTLGMLTESQAVRLKEAGLTAYNHNLDTSREFYDKVITTRTYDERLDTLRNVAKAGISACCGGILGMGESEQDRISLLHTLANLDPQPESVPINVLVPVTGTPLEGQQALDIFEWVRCIAVARILMPKAMVRLSAGRLTISKEAQALAFLAGANAIFTGEKLLTTPNPGKNADTALLAELGLQPRVPFKDEGKTSQEAA
ncbi:MAG: biotin synthase BioB [Alphaproteobacteria bacterium]|nr:biotin synthase BioB [Alphaproteobacteria bacterium]MCB9975204.1 biotin synthase BioB [Rhodospirillales bacterium]